jgi:hypothetical protein
LLRCSHALTSRLFDTQADCRQFPSALTASMCNSDCQSVLSIHAIMEGAKMLARADVGASAASLVRHLKIDSISFLTADRH